MTIWMPIIVLVSLVKIYVHGPSLIILLILLLFMTVRRGELVSPSAMQCTLTRLVISNALFHVMLLMTLETVAALGHAQALTILKTMRK